MPYTVIIIGPTYPPTYKASTDPPTLKLWWDTQAPFFNDLVIDSLCSLI